MTATADKETSQYWERIFDLPLPRALQLAEEPRDLFDAVAEAMDGTAADRILIAALQVQGIDTEGLNVGADELADTLLDVATRLVKALEEVRALVKLDHDRANAAGIVRMARAEGRIPAHEPGTD